jgi:hypothetical protein
MPDIADRPYDDAPLSTSRDQDAAVSTATAEAVEDRGDSFAGWAVTINRPSAELYAWWRDFSNLASVMENVERVDVLDGTRRDLARFKQLMETGEVATNAMNPKQREEQAA